MADQTSTAVAETDSDKALDRLGERAIVDANWDRYRYGRDRGHRNYTVQARRCEDYYLGGGSQWSSEDKEVMDEEGRMALEFNEILPGINSAIGYQIANRMDITFEPRGGLANQATANVLNKVVMQIADNTKLHWKETEVFSDGLIQQRGYFDIRIGFNDTMRGEVEVSVDDPMDVIPDPDAKSYDPDGWGDVTSSRWLSLDDIERLYGLEARQKAAKAHPWITTEGAGEGEGDHGDADSDDTPRNKFGDEEAGDSRRGEGRLAKLRIVERQIRCWERTEVIVSPDTGDVRVIEGFDEVRKQTMLMNGGIRTVRMATRIKWVVTTSEALLFNSYSPYPWFTKVPFFAFFRRGRTRGLVDNAMGPQDALNKAGSQFIHLLNSAANSGWKVEKDSLTNMTTEGLEQNGAKNGVVIEYKKGSTQPEKIQPSQIPAGLDRLIERLTVFLKELTTPDALRGIDDDDASGVARKAKQYAAQQQLAVPLDNLARTRHMVADRILWCIQHYYDEPRIYHITRKDPVTGENVTEELAVNTPDPATGELLNDLTLGEYNVIVNERPMQVTFENGEFEQAVKMREIGVRISDARVVRSSALADKEEALKEMADQANQQQIDPLTQAKIKLLLAQVDKTNADAVAKSVEAVFSGINTAQVIAQTPQTAPLADQILRSAGFVDRDAAPIVPELPAPIPALDLPTNTNPNTPLNPANPGIGITTGIEAGV